MTKTEFLSASLPYGLMFKNRIDETIERLSGVDTYITANWAVPKYTEGAICVYSNIDYGSMWSINEITSIVRPLSDLTNECVQADYNNGKPFVPIVELAKIAFGDISVIETKSKKNISGIRFVDEDSDTCVFVYDYETGSFGAHVERLEKTENEFINVYYQIELFQHLLKWHFDLITEDCEKVYVTEDFNPYK